MGKPARRSTLMRKDRIAGYLLVSPWIIGLTLFLLIPMISAVVFSFTEYSFFFAPKFTGIQNYSRMFSGDNLFYKSLAVTLKYVIISVPLYIIFGLILALLVNQKIKLANFFRSVIYMPSMMVGMSVYIAWQWMLNPKLGVINTILGWFGITGPGWLLDDKTALISLVLMGITGLGSNMVIFLAALKEVPEQLYEAAEIDGASKFRQFLTVTLPMISPSVYFLSIMGTIGAFQIVDVSLVMTNGGPNYSTYFYALHMYYKAFQDLEFGYACSLAIILFIAIVVLTALQNWFSKKWVYYEGQ